VRQRQSRISALCQEFTNALTEVLAENAVGLARRGRIARTHAVVKRHPEYNEHALCVAVETAFMRWEVLQNNAPSHTAGTLAINPRRTEAYGFGVTRVATLVLLTFITLPA
jgi:hypothetical protein